MIQRDPESRHRKLQLHKVSSDCQFKQTVVDVIRLQRPCRNSKGRGSQCQATVGMLVETGESHGYTNNKNELNLHISHIE